MVFAEERKRYQFCAFDIGNYCFMIKQERLYLPLGPPLKVHGIVCNDTLTIDHLFETYPFPCVSQCLLCKFVLKRTKSSRRLEEGQEVNIQTSNENCKSLTIPLNPEIVHFYYIFLLFTDPKTAVKDKFILSDEVKHRIRCGKIVSNMRMME